MNILNYLYPKVLTNRQITKTASKKQVALTFDDILFDDYDDFEAVVKILDDNNMKGTFFVISGCVDMQTKTLLIETVKNGH